MFDIRVVSVKPLDNCKLFVRFNNRIEKEYDVKRLFEELDYMTELEHNKQLFDSVKVDVKGHAIYWNEDLDIPAYELWENGVMIVGAVKQHCFNTIFDNILIRKRKELDFLYGSYGRPEPRSQG